MMGALSRSPRNASASLFILWLSAWPFHGRTQAATPTPLPLPRDSWVVGTLVPSTNDSSTDTVSLEQWPPGSRVALPASSNWVAAYFRQNGKRIDLSWLFNPEATQVHLELPSADPRTPPGGPVRFYLESAEHSQQCPDGRIIFSALDAEVHGRQAKLESNPGNHRIGFWTDRSDTVLWKYKPTRWGKYDVELVYSADGGEGTELEIEVAGQKLAVTRPSTGTWYRYRTLPVGRVYLAKAEPFTVSVLCKTLRGAAALNLKAILLRPAPEGQPIVQAPSGTVTLAARDALTHSTMMRYEPATNKNCLGFWVNPSDWAEWEFAITHPAVFEVEVWQGCGKGNGGSEVTVVADAERLSFVVEDTGHFQNFIPRRIGQVHLASAGTHTVSVRPVKKTAAAVMDIRQIRLVPVGAAPVERGIEH
ncbi:MAG TPA: hypothetical protein VNU68_33975 [Verrucomicrobiae bacterium]|nr:hypothetical protein [Verrucomicrobiae bacterium]